MRSYPKKYIYSFLELRKEVETLRQTFNIIRLVSPERCESYHIGESGLVYNGSCGLLWNRAKECEICAPREVVATRGCNSRLETVGNRTYIVISKYIQLEGRPFALELIMELTCMAWLDEQEYALDEIRRLQEENSRLLRDSLTGCYSRHYMDTLFQHYLLEAQNNHLELCAALIDMDDFKDINDTYGHTIGDEVLKSCAHFWMKYFDVRKHSFITRYGGDEFIITALASSFEEFCHHITVLDNSMRKSILLESGENIPFSFTVGCAHISELGAQNITPSCAALVSLADKRMYAGKQKGKSSITTE